jgi:hypothetical protein
LGQGLLANELRPSIGNNRPLKQKAGYKFAIIFWVVQDLNFAFLPIVTSSAYAEVFWLTHWFFKRNSGGGEDTVFEPLSTSLTVTRVSRVQWFRDKIDIDRAELAELRWSKKWKVGDLAAHFGVGTTSIKMQLKGLKKCH